MARKQKQLSPNDPKYWFRSKPAVKPQTLTSETTKLEKIDVTLGVEFLQCNNPDRPDCKRTRTNSSGSMCPRCYGNHLRKLAKEEAEDANRKRLGEMQDLMMGVVLNQEVVKQATGFNPAWYAALQQARADTLEAKELWKQNAEKEKAEAKKKAKAGRAKGKRTARTPDKGTSIGDHVDIEKLLAETKAQEGG
jgi:hypothetical protein